MTSFFLNLLILMAMTAVSLATFDAAQNQIQTFMEQQSGPIDVLRLSSGAEIDYNSATVSLNKDFSRNSYYMELFTHIVRDKIAGRSAHEKGTGGFGYFVLTDDFSDICKAKLFTEVGKQTQVAVRFSLETVLPGAPDNAREPRGFAVKFYTDEGNFDLVCLHTPVFAVKEPLAVPGFIRTLKRNPATNMKDLNMLWDFINLNPESYNLVLRLFADGGIPQGYEHMPGFSVHTFQLVNDQGVSSFVRFHFTPESGIKNLNSTEAFTMAANDPDYTFRSLYNAIESGDYPTWTLGAQVLTEEQVKNAPFDVFDVTKSLDVTDYPVRKIGRLVLNKNPTNVFAQIEQLAFCPGNLIPGILGAPDKIFEARLLAYRDAQLYRLGVNYNKIDVNKPIMKTCTYNRDGVSPVGSNDDGAPNYYLNSFYGPAAKYIDNNVEIIKITEKPADNIDQIRAAYANEFSEEEKTRMIDNIVAALVPTTESIQKRTIRALTKINADLGRRVCSGLYS